jgi:hypothetical protein
VLAARRTGHEFEILNSTDHGAQRIRMSRAAEQRHHELNPAPIKGYSRIRIPNVFGYIEDIAWISP